MPQRYDWTTNDKEGRTLRRIIDKLAKKAETTEDVPQLCTILHAISNGCNAKARLVNNEEIERIKKELAELKRLAGIAQVNIIPA